MGFPNTVDENSAEYKAALKEAKKLVAASEEFTAYTIYEQKRQEFRKAGTLDENAMLVAALLNLAKHDGDKVEPTLYDDDGNKV